MQVELWQVPLLVMAGIVLFDLIARFRLRERWRPWNGIRPRVAALWLVGLATAATAVAVLGADLADKLASVATATAYLVTLFAYREPSGRGAHLGPSIQDRRQKPASTGGVGTR